MAISLDDRGPRHVMIPVQSEQSQQYEQREHPELSEQSQQYEHPAQP